MLLEGTLLVLGGLEVMAGIAMVRWPEFSGEIGWAVLGVGILTVCAGAMLVSKGVKRQRTQLRLLGEMGGNISGQRFGSRFVLSQPVLQVMYQAFGKKVATAIATLQCPPRSIARLRYSIFTMGEGAVPVAIRTIGANDSPHPSLHGEVEVLTSKNAQIEYVVDARNATPILQLHLLGWTDP